MPETEGLRRREAELEAEVARLLLAQDITGIGSFETFVETDDFVATNQFYRLFGLEPRERAPTTAITDLILPEDKAKASTFATRLSGAGLESAEYRIRRPDTGDVRWIERQADFVAGSTGRPPRLLGTARDTTDRKNAELRQVGLMDLGDRLRELLDTADMAEAAVLTLGRTLSAARAGYGRLDALKPSIHVEAEWRANPSIVSVIGLHTFAGYGAHINGLLLGRTVAIPDIEQDPRMRPGAERLRALQIRGLLDVPLMEHGQLVAVFFLHDATKRNWTDDDIAFVRTVADRTWAAMERARAEADLRRLNETLEAQVVERTRERDRAWKNSQDLQLIIDSHGAIQAANEAWTTILGWHPRDTHGRNYRDFIHPDDHRSSEHALETAAQSDLPVFENRIRHKDGNYCWIAWVAAPDDGRIYASGRNVSAEKEAAARLRLTEEQLRQANTHLDTALATMGNGLCLWDAADRLVLANERLYEILGLPPDKIVPGLTFRDYLALRHAAGNFGATDRATVFEQRLALVGRREGVSHMDVTTTGRSIATLYRPVAAGGWIATYEDVTEQREIERALAATEANLLRERGRLAEEASRVKSSFLAMMSHEIRTPMNAVLGLADSLLNNSLLPEQQEMVQAIHDSGDILLRLLNDILDFTKLDAGQMTFEDAAFSPFVLTHAVASVLSPYAVAKGLVINVERDVALPPELVGDAGRIRQILLNLGTNAVKFTERGMVTIRAEYLTQDRLSATVRWSVSDTGIGITADRIDSLFNEFVQADSSSTRRFGGTGLGLALSKQLITQMGGTIAIGSTVGVGTTVRVDLRLPISEQPPAASPKQEDPGPDFRSLLAARSDRLRILFAEDNPTNQLVVRRLLIDLDIQVDIVGDGQGAVEAATRFVYDVIFMDMRMPGMDGLQAARAIRQRGGRLLDIPIIALTANAFAEDVKACKDAGMNAFLPKPVNQDMLLTAMLEVLSPGKVGGLGAPQAAVLRSTAAVCDHAALAELRDEIGSEAVDEMFALFETDARARLRTMMASLDDPAVLLHEAHSLRGAAATVSAPALTELSGAIEARVRAGGTVREADIEEAQAAFESYLVARP